MISYEREQAPRQVLELAALLVPRLLSGDHPQLRILREQYQAARIESVVSSGVGFFVNYQVPDGLSLTVPANFAGGDATIAVAGMEASAGCVVFVREGRLSMFEAYTSGDAWPPEAEVVDVGEVFSLLVPEA